MLVYLKEPMGHTTIGGIRVYGRKYSYGFFGPTDLPLKLYKTNLNILEEAEYTQDWLEKKYYKPFPNISFKLSNIQNLPFNQIVDIARGIGIDYIKTRNTNNAQKNTLIRTIRKKLS